MHKPSEHILIIFGASGDLTRRKLIPALTELQKLDLLPEKFAVLGIGRTDYDDASYRRMISKYLEDPGEMLSMLHYLSMDPEDKDSYVRLSDRLTEMTAVRQMVPNFIFYLATPPGLYATVPAYLSKAGLTREQDGIWRRIIVEKPFGTDYLSARDLNISLLGYLQEHQIYRIDHYLGKETVQNVLVTRFSNGIFEPLWNRNFVHHVEITSSESLGVGSRGGYYDHSGALRDMLQNHLLQLVGLVAMEPPTVISSDAIRNETLKVFQSLRPITGEDIKNHVIRGQYMASHVRGEAMPGYREEDGVPLDSRTETFVAMKLFIDNWRWGSVPFYIRTGKRLPTRVSEIVVHFNPSPHTLFCERETGAGKGNQLVIRIQPDEGILLKFGMKVQGAGFKVQDVNMDFHYEDLTNSYIPEAYQRLLLDCMQGDSTLYTRDDAVEAAWRFVDPILRAWEADPNVPLHGYPCGTWGPEVADQMIEGETYTWRYPCKNLADDGLYCEL
ncbi:MAG: glucose-6-phosphate dehydrogenase [Bacteroidales bacterium]|nr:glucose-6-phosphate dehydrogenase [Bacteroidales bacterium]